MSNTPRALGGFPILALHPKSLRQIGNLWFFGTNSGSISEPLMGGSFFCGERGGDRSIGEANLRKGAALQWLAARAALALHPKALRQIGNLWFSEPILEE